MTAAGLRDRAKSMGKDMNLRLDAFSASPRLFDVKTYTFGAREELFYVDYDMIPLLVQQAYPSTVEKSGGPELGRLQRMAR